uniref:hypothetical protein n=1 Tax=Altererythrobacter segetis TaxID=1104773 RepID=UPI00140D0782|nr:hypothetical protein [Altererythrobacter segetis]
MKLLLALIARDNGERNGSIGFSCREAAVITGTCERTCWSCFRELQDKGFIRATSKGAFSRKVLHSTLWRYTWAAWPGGKPSAPTRDFETWRCVEIHGCKICDRAVANIADLDGNDSPPDAKPASGDLETSLVSVDRRSAKSATLIVYQGEGEAGTETPGRKQATPTSGPISAPLRALLIDHLQASEPGEQSRLAVRLGIPAGTLSKFIHGRNLPAQHRETLAAELQWSAAA